MNYHKLLQQQINKYFPEGVSVNTALDNFFSAVNESYLLFENEANCNTDKITDEEINIEIHKRKETEDSLNRTVKLLTTLLSSLNSGILVENEERKILYTNQLFCNMFSIPALPNQMIGIDCSDSAEQSKHNFEDSEYFVKRISEILENRNAIFSDELKLKDGRILERDYIPIYVDNEYKGHLWKYTDITERKNFQNQLVDITNIQNAILNGTDYSIIYTDINGIIKSFNQGAEKMLGYTSNEVIGVQTPFIFHDPYEVAFKAKKLSEELGYEIKNSFDVFVAKSRNKIVETNEWTYIKKNGERINVLLSVSSIRNSDNEIIGYLGIARDITEQKIAEAELKFSEERYRNIVEHSTDIIYKINNKGYFTYVNPVAERITGFYQNELISQHFTKLIKEEYRREATIFYNKQIKQKKSTTYYEFPIITKSGEERWIGQSVQLTEFKNAEFELTALAIDVTERKNYERTIFLQKEKYQHIIANMNLGLMEVDKNDHIQFLNPRFEFISGYKQEELIGKNATKLLVSESHLDLVKSKAKLRARGLSDMYELPVKNKNGELRWWMISGAPNYDNKGNITGSIGIHLDITEQKKLELELELAKIKAEESSKAKEAFLANMSHEIRTPLNAIIGMVRELSKENLSDKQKTYVENTYVSSQHLLSVLNNVLDVSKIEAGELQLDLHHFDLNKTINDVKAILLSKCIEKGIYLSIKHKEQLNTVFIGDSSRFRQILLNIIGNAVKFTDRGGINVEYDISDLQPGYHNLFISVKDSGVGMEQAYLETIFNKFSQEDTSTSRKYGGSGLGMTITKELVELMNGTIEVKSKKNEGTEILMNFTIAAGDSSKLLKEENSIFNQSHKTIEVLLVEDNDFNRLIVGNTLHNFNFHVIEAKNGIEAIEVLKSGKLIDVILMDLQMPLMDGFECTSIIRTQLKMNTPIIALTANAFKSELEQCLKVGMNDSITKPYEEIKLIDTIYKLLQINSTSSTITYNITLDSTEKLYNLDHLRAFSRGDKVYYNKMLSIFIEQSVSALTEIREEYESKNLTKVFQIVHRIKSSIHLMGIDLLREPLKYIEKTAKEQLDSDELKKQISFLNIILNKVINQLSDEFI